MSYIGTSGGVFTDEYVRQHAINFTPTNGSNYGYTNGRANPPPAGAPNYTANNLAPPFTGYNAASYSAVSAGYNEPPTNPLLVQRLVTQRDSQLNSLDPTAKDSACLFRSLQAAVELKLGRTLSAEQIVALKQAGLTDGGLVNDKNNYYIKNDDIVLRDTVETLGGLGISATSDHNPTGAAFCIEQVKSLNGNTHYVLSDADGNRVWDPSGYNNCKSEVATRNYIHFTSNGTPL